MALGSGALEAATTGNSCVAIGADALDVATTSVSSIGIGSQALGSLTTGHYNTAIGDSALTSQVDKQSSTAVGKGALDAANSDNCTAVGVDALGAVTTGANNVSIGAYAGSAVTTGANNIFLGRDAGLTASPGGNITTASNEIGFGDENISAANIQVDWTIASDKRDKTDVSPLDLGLEFINQLEPVTYRWDKRSKYGDDQSIIPDGTHKEEQLEGGLLAQDVEVIENQYGYQQSDKTNLITKLSEDGKMYGIKYSKLVPMLIKAVQELSAEVEELKNS